MGVTHMWYTGVIEHASMNNFMMYGITADDADVVKGRAGSPYAIKDYYDVKTTSNKVLDIRLRLEKAEKQLSAEWVKVVLAAFSGRSSPMSEKTKIEEKFEIDNADLYLELNELRKEYNAISEEKPFHWSYFYNKKIPGSSKTYGEVFYGGKHNWLYLPKPWSQESFAKNVPDEVH